MKVKSRNRARKGSKLPTPPAALNPPTSKPRSRKLSKRKQRTFPTAATTAPETPEPEPTYNPSEPTHSATHQHPPATLLTLPPELRQLILQLSLPFFQLKAMDKLELEAHAAELGAIHPVIRADMQFVARQWEKERAAAWKKEGFAVWAARGRYPSGRYHWSYIKG